MYSSISCSNGAGVDVVGSNATVGAQSSGNCAENAPDKERRKAKDNTERNIADALR